MLFVYNAVNAERTLTTLGIDIVRVHMLLGNFFILRE